MARHPWLVGVALFLALSCKGQAGTDVGETGATQPEGRTAAEQDPEALRRRAIDLHEAGDREGAIPLFERVAELRPGVRAWLDLALAYGSVARLDESQAAYERILEVEPDHAIALHNMGNLQAKRGLDAESVDWYLRAVKIRPDYLLAWAHLGDAYRRSGEARLAYRAYERVLSIEPGNGTDLAAYDESLFQMASLDLRMGAPERAKLLLEELLRGNPQHAKAYYAYGQLLLQAGRPEEAQAAFDRHMEILAAEQPTGPAAMDR